MVISEIIGGLGNQMFQYAAGWALARDLNVEFKLDISAFCNYPLHQGFEIETVFKAHLDIATEQDIRSVLGWQSNVYVKRVLARPRLAPLRKSSMLVEPHFHYVDLAHRFVDNAYLSGYWQSEKYFYNYAEDIRAQFQFRQSPGSENIKWVDMIAKKAAISIHIRRGDFISPKNTAIHGVCSVEYFAAAVNFMIQHIPSAEFFIFSDDVTWAKENLHFSSPCHFIENNKGEGSFNDMRLMSLCDHHIIANSSFSWWGAWLNASADKIVIAPKKWFANGLETPDLLPGNWITL